jgi:uncharacterized membrane protein
MNWILYPIAAYAVVACANIIDKLLVARYIKDSSLVVLFTGTIACITGFIIYFIRGFPVMLSGQFALVLAAGVLLELYLLPYFKALELEDASTVVPLFQAVPLFTLLLSWVFLKEQLLLTQYVGFVLLLGSGFVLAASRKKHKRALSVSFWYMMLSSLLFAVSTLLFKFVTYSTNVWDAIAYESMGIGLGTLIIASWPGYVRRYISYARKLSVSGWGALAASESLYIVYRIFMGIALSLGSVVVVNVLGGLQPAFVFLYGYTLSQLVSSYPGEKIDKKTLQRKAIALGGIFIGLYFVYM